MSGTFWTNISTAVAFMPSFGAMHIMAHSGELL